jgi:hypothetical protein
MLRYPDDENLFMLTLQVLGLVIAFVWIMAAIFNLF